MSVPPTGRRPSSSSSSKDKPEESGKQSGKDFKLPSRKEPVERKGEEPQKKKGLFDIAGKEAQEKQPNLLTPDMATKTEKAEKISPTDAAAQVTQIGQLINKMVDNFRIGQLDGKDFASLKLKDTTDVPQAFAGSHLTLSYETNGLVIHFDHFMTPQQQNTAITLVEQNKEQLEQMVQVLNAKNIQVAELSIGEHTVALPRIAPLPPPFQTSRPIETETQQQQDRGGRGDQGQQQSGSEGGPR